jgi:hypothetical protein
MNGKNEPMISETIQKQKIEEIRKIRVANINH